MHILLIHQAFAALDEAGGTRHFEMACYLANHGHKVTIISSPVSYLTGKPRGNKIPWVEKQEPRPGVTILRTYTYPALHRSFSHRVLSFLSFMVSSFSAGVRVKHVDLVWGTSPPIFQGITAWLLAKIKRVPFLFEVRDLWPAFAIAIGVLRNPILIHASLWLERFLYGHADRVIVNSPGFVEHVHLRGARRIELIPNGADPAMFDPQAGGQSIRRQLGLDGNFIVLYAGAYGLSNDLGIVLQAADQLRANQAVRIVFVGDGKEKPALLAQAKEMNLENVLFLPPVPKTEMCTILAAADACIAILKPIELYKTTYPNKVFDYMAAGRPVILAIDGVIKTLVETAKAGLAVEPGNPKALACAIQQLSDDRNHARELGLAGRTYVERYYNRADLSQKLALVLEDLGRSYGRKNSGR
ncbi:MAG: glycosyltransferase family 4 protein [Anaerolineaceae bacterium]|nr:glycosyltransferase family 4 protein [Anaerolineaceae bacterium]